MKDLECMQQAEKAKWAGEGLPPVGVECEFNIANEPLEDWKRAFVVGHYAGRVVFCMPYDRPFLTADGFPRFFSNGDPKDFRPIRSEEDRAVEEMVPILRGATKQLGSSKAKAAALALCRAGYRKHD